MEDGIYLTKSTGENAVRFIRTQLALYDIFLSEPTDLQRLIAQMPTLFRQKALCPFGLPLNISEMTAKEWLEKTDAVAEAFQGLFCSVLDIDEEHCNYPNYRVLRLCVHLAATLEKLHPDAFMPRDGLIKFLWEIPISRAKEAAGQQEGNVDDDSDNEDVVEEMELNVDESNCNIIRQENGSSQVHMASDNNDDLVTISRSGLEAFKRQWDRSRCDPETLLSATVNDFLLDLQDKLRKRESAALDLRMLTALVDGMVVLNSASKKHIRRSAKADMAWEQINVLSGLGIDGNQKQSSSNGGHHQQQQHHNAMKRPSELDRDYVKKPRTETNTSAMNRSSFPAHNTNTFPTKDQKGKDPSLAEPPVKGVAAYEGAMKQIHKTRKLCWKHRIYILYSLRCMEDRIYRENSTGKNGVRFIQEELSPYGFTRLAHPVDLQHLLSQVPTLLRQKALCPFGLPLNISQMTIKDWLEKTDAVAEVFQKLFCWVLDVDDEKCISPNQRVVRFCVHLAITLERLQPDAFMPKDALIKFCWENKTQPLLNAWANEHNGAVWPSKVPVPGAKRTSSQWSEKDGDDDDEDENEEVVEETRSKSDNSKHPHTNGSPQNHIATKDNDDMVLMSRSGLEVFKRQWDRSRVDKQALLGPTVLDFLFDIQDKLKKGQSVALDIGNVTALVDGTAVLNEAVQGHVKWSAKANMAWEEIAVLSGLKK
ncbi:hypothetical protein HDU76_009062 [Blyttiomyces sp. JEL0837]|nr:hypothetical protein HDU76_009062 [Blyttiomyces sp. JEL0837]